MNSSIYNLMSAPSSALPTDSATAKDTSTITSDQQALDTAKKFESLLIHTMLKNMRSASADNPLINSDQINLYKDMFDQKISKEIADNGSFGLADVFYRQLTGKPAPEINALPRNPLSTSNNAIPATLYNGTHNHRSTATGTANSISSNTDNISPEQFVARISHYAEEAAHRLGTSREAVIAIAALETGWGKSIPLNPNGTSSHNLFGIKADAHWQGKQSIARTSEYYNGAKLSELAAFRAYSNEQQSVQDFALFIERNPRYKPAMANADNSESFIRELQRAGYATDPEYANKVITIMNQVKRLH